MARRLAAVCMLLAAHTHANVSPSDRAAPRRSANESNVEGPTSASSSRRLLQRGLTPSPTATPAPTPAWCPLLSMYDNHGDGWDGASFQVVDSDGTIVVSETLDNASCLR